MGVKRGMAFLLLATILAASSAQAQTEPAAPPQLTTQQWREDLRFMAAELRTRHPNPFHQVSRAQFEAAVADLDARIPAMQRNEIVVGMMRIAALIGDGHTRIEPRKDGKFGFPSLPLKLYLFEDGLFVRAASSDYRALVGARIEAIGGVPVAEALRRVAGISPGDNAMGPRLFAPIFLAMPDILQALKLSDDRKAVTLQLSKGGRSWTAKVQAAAVEPLWPADTDISLTTPQGWADARTGAAPLWLQAPLERRRLVELPNGQALYAQLNMVADAEGETLSDFGARIANRAREGNPRAVILDLRLNQGGNGDIRNGFVRDLIRSEDADTRLFVLTARGTFSASQFILDDLDRLSDAVFIGEPASSKPSSYGDAYRTTMPNSGISVRTSILWWQAGQNRDPWTWVDVAAPLRFTDYAAGRDPALEAALAYAPQPSLAERLATAAKAGGVGHVEEVLAGYRVDPRNRYADWEGEMLKAAQALAGAESPEVAFAVAQATATQFPQSADAQTMFALVAEMAGRKLDALTAAKRAIAIDPDNRSVRPLLERLQAS
jgi:hypothetical protein